MCIFKKVNANLAVFSFYIPSLVCFPIVILYEAWVTSPPRNDMQYVGAGWLSLVGTAIAIRLIIAIFNVRHGKYSPSQIKTVIRSVSIASLVLPACDALGLISVNHSWWAAVPIIYTVYGIYVVVGLYKNHLVPEGFTVKDKERQ